MKSKQEGQEKRFLSDKYCQTALKKVDYLLQKFVNEPNNTLEAKTMP